MELNFEFFYNLPIERNKKVLMLLRSQETHKKFLDCSSHSAARSVKEKSTRTPGQSSYGWGWSQGHGKLISEINAKDL